MIKIPYGYAVTHNELIFFVIIGMLMGIFFYSIILMIINKHKQREKLISQMCTKDKELYQKFFRNL